MKIKVTLAICCLPLLVCAAVRADTVTLTPAFPGTVDISGPGLTAQTNALDPTPIPSFVTCSGTSCVLGSSTSVGILIDFDPEECVGRHNATFDGVTASCIKGSITLAGPIGGADTLSGSISGYDDTLGTFGEIVTLEWTVIFSETGTSSTAPSFGGAAPGVHPFTQYTFVSTPELPSAFLLVVGIAQTLLTRGVVRQPTS